ncbi:hypothetical protein [Parvibaculum sp.]|uniref:hypothetical protein n=1 Tax=Parvibaculum sp. TaxID=2024848 RepID=UPI0027368963|nr:hypothetical protein [Parvibaculum sp.]MDP3327713.1 hypothetical protein [Parvibaculum sp.]
MTRSFPHYTARRPDRDARAKSLQEAARQGMDWQEIAVQRRHECEARATLGFSPPRPRGSDNPDEGEPA